MDYNKIYDLLMEVHSNQKDLKTDVGKIHKNIEDLSVDVKYLNALMQGNGKPGMTRRVVVLERKVKKIIKKAKITEPKNRSLIKKLIGTFIILSVVFGTVYSVTLASATETSQSE